MPVGAKFWLQVVTELKNRGVADIFIACVDGLKGFAEAIEAVYPKAQVQLCVVHMVRYSLQYVSWKHRKEVAADLKKIYQSPTREEAERQLERFALEVGSSVPINQPIVEEELGADHAVLRLPSGDSPSDLHHQRDRIGEHVIAQDHQESRIIPDGRSGGKIAVPGARQHQPAMDDADQGLEGSTQPVQHHL